MDLALLTFAAINVAAAMSGAVNKPGDWYAALEKPQWTPADWVFPVVWTVLFGMITAAGWLAWSAGAGAGAMALYGLQLALNAAWSYLFFGRQRPDWALACAAALWLSIAATAAAFAVVSTVAALLMLPYLAWVGVAYALNRAIMRRNPVAAAP